MKRRQQPQVTEGDFRRFKKTLQAAKADERQRQAHGQDSPPMVYHDALLRTLLVVEHGGQLWLVPRRLGGWSGRQQLVMTDTAKVERLTLAHDVTASWLGIDTEDRCEVLTEASAAGEP